MNRIRKTWISQHLVSRSRKNQAFHVLSPRFCFLDFHYSLLYVHSGSGRPEGAPCAKTMHFFAWIVSQLWWLLLQPWWFMLQLFWLMIQPWWLMLELWWLRMGPWKLRFGLWWLRVKLWWLRFWSSGSSGRTQVGALVAHVATLVACVSALVAYIGALVA